MLGVLIMMMMMVMYVNDKYKKELLTKGILLALYEIVSVNDFSLLPSSEIIPELLTIYSIECSTHPNRYYHRHHNNQPRSGNKNSSKIFYLIIYL